MSTDDKPIVVSVGELTQNIKRALNTTFRSVWVEGELSNVKYQSSGHGYFTLKDTSAQLPCAMFAGNLRAVNFRLADGIKVRAFGDIDVYAPRGAYQLVVRKLERSGDGDLMAKLEELKKKLEAEGFFDKQRKRPLPLVPGCVGIVTSPTGAAIRDMFNVTRRRCPNMRIILAPAKVQGEGAKEEIVHGIEALNALPPESRPDVLIVGRGGGSIEDLWCFNEEIVARAVHNSAIPVISAVGHETDFTICDFVADERAPTPSAAAEIVAGRKDDFLAGLAASAIRMQKSLTHTLENRKARLDRIKSHHVFMRPRAVIEHHAQRIDLLEERMRNTISQTIANVRRSVDEFDSTIRHTLEIRQSKCAHEVDALSRQLEALSPYAVFKRGYSVALDKDGMLIRSADSVKPGDTITTRLSDGDIKSTVDGNTPVRHARKRVTTGDSPQLTLF